MNLTLIFPVEVRFTRNKAIILIHIKLKDNTNHVMMNYIIKMPKLILNVNNNKIIQRVYKACLGNHIKQPIHGN